MTSNTPITKQLLTVRDYIRWGVTQFSQANLHYGHGTDNAVDESSQLVLHTLGIPIGSETTLLDANLTEQEKQHVLSLIERRIEQRIPVPYLTGTAWFAGLPFKVNEHVLIPRSPIAELINRSFEPWLADRYPERILDLCAGSGCIGIACAHLFEEAEVELTDLSLEALSIAQINIQNYELGKRVSCIESDLFSALAGQQFDLIVSNPPYVDREDFDSMPAEYRHEPEMALTSGADGLDITRRILSEAALHLSEQGVLIVEVGNSGAALEQAYGSVPFTWIEFERGGHGVFVFTKAELLEYASEFSDG